MQPPFDQSPIFRPDTVHKTPIEGDFHFGHPPGVPPVLSTFLHRVDYWPIEQNDFIFRTHY
jgi:hypothetical protein